MKPFDPNGRFAAAISIGDGTLRKATVRGAGVTVFAGAMTMAIQVFATMVLARLLTPADFGIVAMVTTFSLLLVNFGFNGLTEAIVQRDEMNHALASTLFWVNAAVGLLLTIAFAEAGSLLARLYYQPAVKQVTVALSITIIATSLSTVHLALLKRAMHFSVVAANDICARAISVIVAIVLGCMGWGYWALVAAAVALPVSTGIGALMLCRWMPGWPRRVTDTGPTLRFALHAYGNFGINYVSRNTDNLLVGWRFNAQLLGFYKKAYDLFALSANQLVASIAVVVVAGLSRVKKDAAVYRAHLLDAMEAMAFVGMGVGAALTLVGKDLILVLLGPKWAPAGQIFTFFGPGIGAMILYATDCWIHLSIGRPDRWLRWSVFEFFATCSLLIVGLHWGPSGEAVAWSVSFWLLTYPGIWYAGRPIRLGIRPVLSITWRYIVAACVVVVGMALAMHAIGVANGTGSSFRALLRVVVLSAIIVPLYLAVVVLLHGGFAPLGRLASLLQEFVGSRKSAQEPLAPAAERTHVNLNLDEKPFDADVPLVSILIPAFNARQWIGDTLRSALAQTWPRIEIIVVDDGSSDDTVAVAREFEALGVRVVVQQNQGAAAARNNAFAHCHGDYIQWLDADDLLAPDKIEKQMQEVLQGTGSRTLLSAAWAQFMYRPWNAIFSPSPLWSDLTPQEWLTRKMQHNVYMQTAAWLVSRELTEAAGPWDTRLLGDDDGEYFCRVILASDGVRFVPESKIYYRVFHFNGLSYIGQSQKKVIAHWLSMELHIQYLRSFGNDARIRSACLQFLRDSLPYFYPSQTQILGQAQAIAAELGESLGAPGLSWKYAWIQKTLGWRATLAAQAMARKTRWRLVRNMDYLLYRMERQKRATLAKPQSRDIEDMLDDAAAASAEIKRSGEIAS